MLSHPSSVIQRSGDMSSRVEQSPIGSPTFGATMDMSGFV